MAKFEQKALKKTVGDAKRTTEKPRSEVRPNPKGARASLATCLVLVEAVAPGALATIDRMISAPVPKRHGKPLVHGYLQLGKRLHRRGWASL